MTCPSTAVWCGRALNRSKRPRRRPGLSLVRLSRVSPNTKSKENIGPALLWLLPSGHRGEVLGPHFVAQELVFRAMLTGSGHAAWAVASPK
ncbi:hypothetical protein AMTR_s00103p00027840 [Amborella trichopoda]|uniref:Uncharacterized protein n=1 Tax=Amborella trichopoda TaxID=13333 RepID=W1NYT5_AMBTC|nr:hypothetical protein AMTR_s00103p00027840 [Amborella trichopoda]